MEVPAEIADLLALNTSLFDDPDKDVSFELKDGKEYAHACVLKASSIVYRAMLTQDMKEKAENSISMPDVDKATMRVFLRLLYTGHVDPSDWSQTPQEEAFCVHQGSQIKGILLATNVLVEWPRLTATGSGGWTGTVSLDADDQNGFEFSVQRDDWKTGHVMIGIAPRDADTSMPQIHNRQGFFGYVNTGTFNMLYAQDGTSRKVIENHNWPVPLSPASIITVKFHRSTASVAMFFSVNGSNPVPVSFNSPIPPGVAYVPALSFSPNVTATVIVPVVQPGALCPLAMLLALAGLGKKYMVSSVMSLCVKAMKARLEKAQLSNDIDGFDKILASAIMADLGPVRFFALEKAKNFTGLKPRYDSGQLSPEVLFELQALWPRPSARFAGYAQLL